MPVATAERPMNTKRRNDVSVKLDADVVQKAKIVASYKDLTLAEYLSETIRPIVLAQLDEEHAKLSRPKGKVGR